MTNGDGYGRGIRKLTWHLVLSHSDYLSYGETRQREALAAARILGIDQRNLFFMGFPDKGLAPIWQYHWDVDDPYVSGQTGRSAAPYQLAVKRGEPYTAPALLNALKKIVSAYRPTDILVTDTYDCHPDHWAAGAFILAAVGSLETTDQNYKPQIFWYYIHDKDHPKLTPRYFLDLGDRWLQSLVPPPHLAIKKRAISAYKTQILVRPSMPEEFARPEETLRLNTVKKILDNPSPNEGIVEWPQAAQIASYMADTNLDPARKYKGALKSAYILREGDAINLRLNTEKGSLSNTFIIR
jgi:LmbE family N-acetylglucosaminyl deacetylase